MRWTMVMLSGLVGCGVKLACTEIGCNGLLTVSLDRDPGTDAQIDVDLGDGPVSCEVATATTEPLCELVLDGSPRLEVVTGMGRAPATIDVTVSVGAAQPEVLAVSVTWADPFYPNGEECDGEDGGCRDGTASIALDAP